MPWYFYVILALCAAAAVVGVLLLRGAVLRRQGRYLHTKVTSKLKRYAALRGYKVLTDVAVPCKGGPKTISHVLVGIFGLLLLDAHEYTGELYATAEDKVWTCVSKKGKRQQFSSLTLELQAKADAVRTLLAANKLYRLTIDSQNVVRSSEKALALFLPQNLPVIRLNRLSALLGRSKYGQDAGVDIDRICGILTHAAETDR